MITIRTGNTPAIDKRIKETFIKNSTAQKTKMYDMYSRFYRWAMDRLNDNGVIAFISNRSFIDSRTFDGFRKTVQQDFDHIYIIDTKSDVRANPKIAGTTHNVFGIQTGVAVLFLVKSSHKKLKTEPCRIEYVAMDDFWKKAEKLAWFAEHKLQNIEFQNITPDKNNNWINNSDNDWDSLIAVCNKEVKRGKTKEAIFELFTNGIVTNRDQWVYDFDKLSLGNKMKYFTDVYNEEDNSEEFNDLIKWSRDLKNEFKRKRKSKLSIEKIRTVLYRPFVQTNYYAEFIFSDMLTANHFEIFGKDLNKQNLNIGFLSIVSTHELSTLASNHLIDLCLLKQGNGGTQCLPLYRYLNQERTDNITDWALELFQKNYSDKKITKENIFHYVYAVLHNPAYRKKYELNLKREFPRIPLYENFWQWGKMGRAINESAYQL
ncbi:MAG: type ISP restriction/modification enzyme [Chitinophagaceae bacterium]